VHGVGAGDVGSVRAGSLGKQDNDNVQQNKTHLYSARQRHI